MLYILPPVKKCQIFQIDESTKSAFQTRLSTIFASPMPSAEAISFGDSRQYCFNELIDFDVYLCFN